MLAYWVNILIVLATVTTDSLARKEADRDKPRNMIAEAVNSTTLSLSWDPPKTADLCPVFRYIVRYKNEEGESSVARQIPGSQTSAILIKLRPSTRYQMRLVAVGCRGKSQPTRWIKAKTLDRSEDLPRGHRSAGADHKKEEMERKAPSKPSALTAKAEINSIHLSWEPPNDDSIVRGYMVGYGEGVPDVNWQYVDNDARSFNIDNLLSASQYVVSLRAFNNAGKGPVVYDLVYTKEKNVSTPTGSLAVPIGLKSRVLSSNNIWLQWIDPSLGRGQKIEDSRYFVVSIREIPQGIERTLTVKATHAVIYDLDPGTEYEFRVKASRDSVDTSFGISLYNTTFELAPSSPPRGITISGDRHRTTDVVVSWTPPRLPNGKITGYLVFYTSEKNLPKNKWIIEGTSGDASAMSITNLNPGRKYYFCLQARNSKGYGPYSEILEYDTSIYSESNLNYERDSTTTPTSSSHAGMDDEDIPSQNDEYMTTTTTTRNQVTVTESTKSSPIPITTTTKRNPTTITTTTTSEPTTTSTKSNPTTIITTTKNNPVTITSTPTSEPTTITTTTDSTTTTSTMYGDDVDLFDYDEDSTMFSGDVDEQDGPKTDLTSSPPTIKTSPSSRMVPILSTMEMPTYSETGHYDSDVTTTSNERTETSTPTAQYTTKTFTIGGRLSTQNYLAGPRDEPEQPVQSSLDFHAVVFHKISAVLSWWEDRNPRDDRNVFYRLTYYREIDENRKTFRYSRSPIFLLEDLYPESIYVYEVSKEDRSQRSQIWSKTGTVDTSVKS